MKQNNHAHTILQIGSPAYVVAHYLRQRRRGRGPSASLNLRSSSGEVVLRIDNPQEALAIAMVQIFVPRKRPWAVPLVRPICREADWKAIENIERDLGVRAFGTATLESRS